MNALVKILAATAIAAVLAWPAFAQQDTKDIVLDQVSRSAHAEAPVTLNDAVVISVLVESPDGSLTPRGTDAMFRTGERFRVKLLASRAAWVSVYNTNPLGQLTREPLWRGEVRPGLETVSPRLRLEGNSGVDLLHVVFEPRHEGNVFAWVSSWLSTGSKDVRLDTQNTPTGSYYLAGTGQGLVSTIRIVHR